MDRTLYHISFLKSIVSRIGGKRKEVLTLNDCPRGVGLESFKDDFQNEHITNKYVSSNLNYYRVSYFQFDYHPTW